MKLLRAIVLMSLSVLIKSAAPGSPCIIADEQVTLQAQQYKRTEFQIIVDAPLINPYDAQEITLDMIITSPAGAALTLPCFYVQENDAASTWQARFSPQETGDYHYHFRLQIRGKEIACSQEKSYQSIASEKEGFLHINNLWTLTFDSGTLFRGIGENVGWEARDFEDPRYTFEYLLTSLAENGANFLRSWMCPWSLPLEWKRVTSTKRYSSSDEYFNPDGIKRMDEYIQLADSLGLYIMLALDSHNALMVNNQWEINNYNIANGGPAATPTEFFTLDAAKAKYKNRLRYLVARWGYSPSIAAWEFFNEIDNAAFTPDNQVLIPLDAVTRWHDEMSTYLKSIDPYRHIVTTSVSHRDIPGLNDLPNIDINQKHIYKRTQQIRPEIIDYVKAHDKPYVIGEFAYEWDWNKDFDTIREGLYLDYKRGLWYGLFSPTPILPMTWWWEFFDQGGKTPYFQAVREISERMLAAGNGSFEIIPVSAEQVEGMAVRCEKTSFVCLFNNQTTPIITDVSLPECTAPQESLAVTAYHPDERKYEKLAPSRIGDKGLLLPNIAIAAQGQLIFILEVQ